METEIAQVCLDGLPAWVATVGALIVPTFAALANFVGKDSWVGKAINYLGLNFTVSKKPK